MRSDKNAFFREKWKKINLEDFKCEVLKAKLAFLYIAI